MGECAFFSRAPAQPFFGKRAAVRIEMASRPEGASVTGVDERLRNSGGATPSSSAAAPPGVARGLAVAAGILALLAAPRAASASLGGDVSSVTVDWSRLNGVDQVVAGPGGHVHEIRLPGGTIVREYLSAAGVVFAVTWRGPFRPNLRQLLGGYFDAFEQEAQAARSRRRGRGPLVVRRPELVVEMGGHVRDFFGRAIALSLVPQAASVAEIQ